MSKLGLLGRLALVLSVIAGVSYVASWNMDLPPWAAVLWKGAGVTLLAAYAASLARGFDGWLIVAVMALGALGDVLLETHGLITGACAFLAGHVAAIVLYLRHRRPKPSAAHLLFAAMIPLATVAIAYVLPSDRALAPGVALYAVGLSLMAAAAWLSAFPRALVGLGALMFVVSDLLIFARGGPLEGEAWVGLGVWGLYYGGQFLICVGVTGALSRRSETA